MLMVQDVQGACGEFVSESKLKAPTVAKSELIPECWMRKSMRHREMSAIAQEWPGHGYCGYYGELTAEQARLMMPFAAVERLQGQQRAVDALLREARRLCHPRVVVADHQAGAALCASKHACRRRACFCQKLRLAVNSNSLHPMTFLLLPRNIDLIE